jgi:hypothetical protein
MLLEQVSVHAFIANNAIKTEAGETLDFKKYRFMFDVYADRSPLICCMKCAQIGFTTYEIIKTAHECRNDAIDILYVLPTADDVKRFSGGKTNKIIAQNPAFQEWTKDKDSIEQKQFGKNTIYYQGSWTERAALMITAKKLVVDEYDRCKQEIVEQYDSRLQSIANPKKAFFSNPSKPDFGIDLWYQKSDQKKWHITHACGNKFVMEENCINYKLEMYQCPICKKEITDEERRMGEWIATSEGEWSGYWIPLWIAPWMPAHKIAEMKREKSAEFFANFVAGLPYLNTNDMLSQPMLEANLMDRVNDQTGRIIIGVDTGHNIHYVMGNKQGIFYHGYIKSVAENEASPIPVQNYDPYDELDKLLARYPQSVMIADQGGDLIGIRKLQAKHKGRVFLCWFTKETRTQQIIRWGEGDEHGRVMVDRNRAIQIVVDEIKDRRFPIYGSRDDWQPYFNHWLNIYRTRDIQGEEGDPQYNWRWIWKRKGADHLALATIYMRVGLDRFAQDLAQVITANDKFMEGVPTADKQPIIPKQYRQFEL